MKKHPTNKPLYQCELDRTELQKAARAALESIQGQDIAGKQMVVTLDGNITDGQDEYAHYRKIKIRFDEQEVLPFLQLAAADNDKGYQALFNKYAPSVRAYETPQVDITFE